MSKNWTYNEGKALINIYSNRKDEYFKTRNKKHFWQNILTDLETLNILESPTTATNVEVKWRSLYRAYKSAKDRGTGTTASKFMYMNEMDEIFADNPIISSIYAVSVGMENNPDPAPMQIEKTRSDSVGKDVENNVLESESNVIEVIEKKRKRKDVDKDTLLSLKKDYYKQKIEMKEQKNEMLQKYIEKKETDRKSNQEDIKELLKSIITNQNK